MAARTKVIRSSSGSGTQVSNDSKLSEIIFLFDKLLVFKRNRDQKNRFLIKTGFKKHCIMLGS